MQVLRRAAFGTARSSAFLATFVVIFQARLEIEAALTAQSSICAQRNLYSSYGSSMPSWLCRLILHKYTYWLMGPWCRSYDVRNHRRLLDLLVAVHRGQEASRRARPCVDRALGLV